MATCSIQETGQDIQVGMGQVAIACKPDRLRTVLGSCVGVALYHTRTRHAVLAHVVLPNSSGRPAVLPGKFADTAIPHMLDLLRREGVSSSELLAKIAGGANMFGHTGPLQIGDANAQAVIQALGAAHIRIAARDLGGTQGRRAVFDCATGEFVVEIAGGVSRVL